MTKLPKELIGEGIRKPERLIGLVVAGEYRAANYRGVRPRWQPRKLLVEGVRDLAKQPLDPQTIELDPLLRRTGLLVTGRDLDDGREKSFYLGSFRSWRAVRFRDVEVFPPLGVEVDRAGERDRVYLEDPRARLAKVNRKARPNEKVLPMATPSTSLPRNTLRAS